MIFSLTTAHGNEDGIEVADRGGVSGDLRAVRHVRPGVVPEGELVKVFPVALAEGNRVLVEAEGEGRAREFRAGKRRQRDVGGGRDPVDGYEGHYARVAVDGDVASLCNCDFAFDLCLRKRTEMETQTPGEVKNREEENAKAD